MLTATLSGFRTVSVKDIPLGVGDIGTADIRMELSSVETQVVVEGTTVALETESPTIGTVIGSQQVKEIPLNGRHWAQLHGSVFEFFRNDRLDARTLSTCRSSHFG